MRHLIPIALVLLATAAPTAVAQDDDEKIALEIKPSQAGERWYRDSLTGQAPFSVSDAEYAKGFWTPRFVNIGYLHRQLILSMPGSSVTVGKKKGVTCTIDNMRSFPPMKLKGLLKVVKVDPQTGVVDLEGVYGLAAVLRPRAGVKVYYQPKSYVLRYTARYAPDDGEILSASYTYKYGMRLITGKGRDYDYPERKGTLTRMTSKELRAWRKESGQQAEPKPLTPVTQKEVDAAIAKGVAALKKSQEKNGSWYAVYSKSAYPLGPTALVLLALLKSDVPPDDPVVKKGFAYLVRQKPTKTYGAGLACMALHALGSGRKKLGPPARALLKRSVVFLVQNRTKDAGWSYPYGSKNFSSMRYDNSNTQYAVLGLRSASLAGVNPGAATWHAILRHFLTSQIDPRKGKPEISGKGTPRGWTYMHVPGRTRVAASGSFTMTCAGAACVLIAQEQLMLLKRLGRNQKAAAARSLRDGVASIEAQYKQFLESYKTRSRANGYLLYGLERIGVLANKKLFAGNDWYQQGARMLLHEQGEDGHFKLSYGPSIATSFALLFFKRATIPITKAPTDSEPEKK